jgi:hypothetical protein
MRHVSVEYSVPRKLGTLVPVGHCASRPARASFPIIEKTTHELCAPVWFPAVSAIDLPLNGFP